MATLPPSTGEAGAPRCTAQRTTPSARPAPVNGSNSQSRAASSAPSVSTGPGGKWDFRPCCNPARTADDGDVDVDRNGLQVLDRDECLGLLGNAVIGRLGLSSGALPVVLPVNFLLDDERVLVRTSPGTKLDRALAGAVVAFEVDDFDASRHSGWSVLVTGVATVVDSPDELARIERLPLARWAPGRDERVIAISTELVTGRRIVLPHRAMGAA